MSGLLDQLLERFDYAAMKETEPLVLIQIAGTCHSGVWLLLATLFAGAAETKLKPTKECSASSGNNHRIPYT